MLLFKWRSRLSPRCGYARLTLVTKTLPSPILPLLADLTMAAIAASIRPSLRFPSKLLVDGTEKGKAGALHPGLYPSSSHTSAIFRGDRNIIFAGPKLYPRRILGRQKTACRNFISSSYLIHSLFNFNKSWRIRRSERTPSSAPKEVLTITLPSPSEAIMKN